MLSRKRPCVFLFLFFIPNLFAQAIIEAGQPVPEFSVRDTEGNQYKMNAEAAGPWLLVFSKADDRYTSSALTALDRLLASHPELGRDLQYWVIFSRVKAEQLGTELPSWARTTRSRKLLLDKDDRIYKAFRVIATPTVVLISRTRQILSAQPGYDAGMEQRIRLTLAKEQGIELPSAATGKAAPPDMALQMGRQLASRKLWERAVPYYEQANAKRPLPPSALLELAKIHIELQNPDEALSILNKLPRDADLSASMDELRERAMRIKRSKLGADPKDGKTSSTAATSTPL